MARKQFGVGAFFGVTIVITFGIGVLLGSNIPLSDAWFQSVVPTALGFIGARSAARTVRRTWVELCWFQALNFISLLVGAVTVSAGLQYWQLVSLVAAFLATLAFGVMTKPAIATETTPK